MAALLVKQRRDAGVICWIRIEISDKLTALILMVVGQEQKRKKWRISLRKFFQCLFDKCTVHSYLFMIQPTKAHLQ